MPSAINLGSFAGMVPRTAPRLLEPDQAQIASGADLTTGELRARFAPLSVFESVSLLSGKPIEAMFRYERNNVEKWVFWDSDVDVVQGPIADDQLGRIYWTGQNEPRMAVFDLLPNAAMPGAGSCYVLGVTPPVKKPSVAAGSGSGSTESRLYRTAFVNRLGETSALSPISDPVSGPNLADWTLTNLDAAPPNTYTVTAAAWAAGTLTLTCANVFGLRAGETVVLAGFLPAGLNGKFVVKEVVAPGFAIAMADDPGTITDGAGTAERDAPHNTDGLKLNVYRASTSGAFQLVVDANGAPVEVTPGAASWVDVGTNKLAEPAESASYLMPPVGLRGLVLLPNGIAAGFLGKDVWLSEPYQLHAFPPDYVQTMSHNVVALGVVGTTLVIATEGPPYEISGVEPATMGGGGDQFRAPWPCLSKRALTSGPLGVIYPCPFGLAIRTSGGWDLLTRDLFTELQWRRMNIASMRATARDTQYIMSLLNEDDRRYVLILNKAERASLTDGGDEVSVLWTDPSSGHLYMSDGLAIERWEGDVGRRLVYDWQSKEFWMERVTNLGVAYVDADFTMEPDEILAMEALIADITAGNLAIIAAGDLGDDLGDVLPDEYEMLGDTLVPLPEDSIDSLTLQLIADGEVFDTVRVLQSGELRLAAGADYRRVSVRLQGSVTVRQVQLARTSRMLDAF